MLDTWERRSTDDVIDRVEDEGGSTGRRIRRMDFLCAQFATLYADSAEAEARRLLAFTLAVGTHFVALDHRPHDPGAVFHRAARLIAGPPQAD